jgi:hypothetical protein
MDNICKFIIIKNKKYEIIFCAELKVYLTIAIAKPS